MAHIQNFKGQGFIQKAGGKERIPLKQGQQLNLGDVVVTLFNSEATIMIAGAAVNCGGENPDAVAIDKTALDFFSDDQDVQLVETDQNQIDLDNMEATAAGFDQESLAENFYVVVQPINTYTDPIPYDNLNSINRDDVQSTVQLSGFSIPITPLAFLISQQPIITTQDPVIPEDPVDPPPPDPEDPEDPVDPPPPDPDPEDPEDPVDPPPPDPENNQNPGNDKGVGNSPWDGETGDSGQFGNGVPQDGIDVDSNNPPGKPNGTQDIECSASDNRPLHIDDVLDTAPSNPIIDTTPPSNSNSGSNNQPLIVDDTVNQIINQIAQQGNAISNSIKNGHGH